MKFNTEYEFQKGKQKIFTEPSLVQEHFEAESNINNIMARYQKTGVLGTGIGTRIAQFGDFSNVPDFQGALNQILEAQDSFLELPSEMREKFNNNPGKLIEFLNDPKNRDEAIKLGLFNAPEAPQEPIKVQVVPEAGITVNPPMEVPK
jgi:phage internal scaffolding protein